MEASLYHLIHSIQIPNIGSVDGKVHVQDMEVFLILVEPPKCSSPWQRCIREGGPQTAEIYGQCYNLLPPFSRRSFHNPISSQTPFQERA